MILFSREEDRIDKYLVEFNREELEEVRIEIIKKCSEIVHHDYDCSRKLSENFACDSLKIRNFKEIKIGEEGTNSRDLMIRKLYHYSYDELEYPYLVKLIDRLIIGDVSAICEIFAADPSKEKMPIDNRIMLLTEEVNSGKLRASEKISRLNRIKKLIETKELNAGQESVFEYYEKVKSLITLTRIDLFDIYTLNRIKDFFDISDGKIVKPKIYELKK